MNVTTRSVSAEHEDPGRQHHCLESRNQRVHEPERIGHVKNLTPQRTDAF
jgi:hypothetical protein